jgi:uncharacterized protein
MPLLEASDYRPPLLFRNGHINTFYPYLFRKINHPGYQRIRVHTPDGDFTDIDTIFNGNRRLAVLLHGLEGSSNSQYILGTSALLSSAGWDIAAINFRSCSGEMNLTPTLYHSGFTDDLHFILNGFKNQYDELFLTGFSLGGNVVMKYLGDRRYQIPENVKAAAGVSVPCDLAGGSIKIATKENYLYQKNFLNSLGAKMKIKAEQFPEIIDADKLTITRTLIDFDNHFTAPLHGFKDAKDYYAQSSCNQFLRQIQIPSLIINALDDTFLPDTSYPVEAALANPDLFLLTPGFGGHVGFTTYRAKNYWSEQKIKAFFEGFSQLN